MQLGNTMSKESVLVLLTPDHMKPKGTVHHISGGVLDEEAKIVTLTHQVSSCGRSVDATVSIPDSQVIIVRKGEMAEGENAINYLRLVLAQLQNEGRMVCSDCVALLYPKDKPKVE